MATLMASLSYAQNNNVENNSQGVFASVGNSAKSYGSTSSTFFNPAKKAQGSVHLFKEWNNLAVIYSSDEQKFSLKNINLNIERNTFESKISEDSIFTFNFNNIEPIWGDEFIKELAKCRFGLNLSRGGPVKYYTSNRIATLVANGMPTLIDEKIKYRDFFSDNEMIFYKDLNELIDKVNFYKRNEEKRIKIGINGKIKYQKIFNNRIVSDYIISKTLNIKSRYKNVWEN